MEQLIQKYIRYFYIALIGGILIQLTEVIAIALGGCVSCEAFILMFLSVVNLILLSNNLRHNLKQQFTECKEDSKLLRFTIAILIGLQAFICFTKDHSWIMLGNHLMTIVVIEIVLSYRIKSIENLERLAAKYAKDKETMR